MNIGGSTRQDQGAERHLKLKKLMYTRYTPGFHPLKEMEDGEQIIKTWSDLHNHQEVWPEAPFEKVPLLCPADFEWVWSPIHDQPSVLLPRCLKDTNWRRHKNLVLIYNKPSRIKCMAPLLLDFDIGPTMMCKENMCNNMKFHHHIPTERFTHW